MPTNVLRGHRRLIARTVWAAPAALMFAVPLSLTAAGSLGEWHIQASPSPSGTINGLTGVSALSERDIWAVGYAGDQPLAEHWDGESWTSAPTAPLPLGGIFYGAAARLPCDVWAIGSAPAPPNGTDRSLIEHWNCEGWSTVPSPAVPSAFDVLRSVATNPAGDTWAVGYYQDPHGDIHPLVEHLVGRRWQIVASPQDGAGAALLGAAVGPDGTLWAVGAFTDVTSGHDRTLIERFHEGNWTIIPGPNHGPDPSALWAVAVSATPKTAVRVAAVGSWLSADGKTLGPLIATWDGFQWRKLSNHLLPSAPHSSAPLYGVALTGTGDVLAAGWVQVGHVAPAKTLIAVAHNGQVRRVSSPNRLPLLFNNELSGASIAPDGTAVVVGLGSVVSGVQQTLIETADG